MKIYKYDAGTLEETEPVEVGLPMGARVLSAGVISNKVRIYAVVNVDAPVETHQFLVVKTGEDIPAGVEIDNWEYLTTIWSQNGKTWHVFRMEP